MFVASIPEIDYRDPWARSFGDRLSDLMRRKRRVAYFYELPDTSTFRYRVYNMVQVLNELSDDVSASWFCRHDYGRIDAFIDDIDVLVVCRARYEDRLNNLITRAKRHGCRVIFDADDLVFDTDYAHLLAHTLDQDLSLASTWDSWFAMIGRIGATARLCDRAIFTNAFLADRGTRSLGKDARIVPNFINREQLDVSRQIISAKRATRYARDGLIHVGYFSGSPSHNKDFAIAADAIAGVLAEDDRVRLRLVGFLDVTGALTKHTGRIDRHGLQDFLNLQRLIGATEINIVPLQDNIFTNCKSELKYFDAGIVGTVTIASPTFVFAKAIQDGVNGRLANAYEWGARIRAAIDDLADGGESYERMAEESARDSEAGYSYVHQLPAILAAIFD